MYENRKIFLKMLTKKNPNEEKRNLVAVQRPIFAVQRLFLQFISIHFLFLLFPIIVNM